MAFDFIDLANITISSGAGGDGIVAWRREKFVPNGGPAGGDGGRGGSVYLQASRDLNTLMKFRFQRKYVADSGSRGGQNRKSGNAAEDLIINVPIGTVVYRMQGDEPVLIGDLHTDGQRMMLARGGRGGRGNQHFATATRQAPEYCEPGQPAQTFDIRLELKLIAEVGLIGLPNAGKSTLLSKISAAKPKIADYPFTTLVPNLGMMKITDDISLTIADIPGLIEGAAEGHGLGHSFLRHIERTRVLFHLIDVMEADYHGIERLREHYDTIRSELSRYNASILTKPEIILFNKIDSILPETLDEIRAAFADIEHAPEIMMISAYTGQGLEALREYIEHHIEVFVREDETQDYQIEAITTKAPLYQIRFDSETETYYIDSALVDGYIRVTDFDTYDGVTQLYARLSRIGILDELRALGIQKDDTIRIGKHELQWSEQAEESEALANLELLTEKGL